MAFRRVLVDRYNWQTIAGNGARTFYSAPKDAVVDFPDAEATRGDNLGALEAHAGPAAGEVLTLVGPADPTLSVIGDATAAGDTLGELETMVATRSDAAQQAAEAAAASDLDAHEVARKHVLAEGGSRPGAYSVTAVAVTEPVAASEVTLLANPARDVIVVAWAMAFADLVAGTVPTLDRRLEAQVSLDGGATWSNGTTGVGNRGGISPGEAPLCMIRVGGTATGDIKARVACRQNSGVAGDVSWKFMKLEAWVMTP